ncbi:MAG TPA: biotin/lipoyl-containing protein [Pyrinomonadaceae bacterium]|nr:biotin/lipoyl-containing protein [Pyrinomonadaceae bacterium]
MKLIAELAGTEHGLIIKIEQQKVFAEIHGRNYEVEIRERNENHYLLLEGTRVFDCRVEQTREKFTVHLDRNEYSIRIIDPKRLSSAQSGSRHDHGAVEIIAPMPGKVVRVLVEAGAAVKAGSSILVVEAMKMQNELKTPKTGTVVSVNAEPGATVNAGDVLAVIE